MFVDSGETDEAAKYLIGNKVLGYDWNATNDKMVVRLSVNVSKKKNKKLRSGPDLTIEALPILKKTKFTTRLCLGITNSFFDFLGIACPFILRFKLLMKDLILGIHEQRKKGDNEVGWDEEVPEFEKEKWLELIAEAVKSEGIVFPRTTRPSNSIGNPVSYSRPDSP